MTPAILLARDDIATLLRTDSAILTLARSKWRKPVTIRNLFRKRIEVPLADLPLLMVTRPLVISDRQSNLESDYTHTLRLYGLFRQEDPEKAQDELVLFEDAVETAILRYSKDPEDPDRREMPDERVISITPGDTALDEGYFHPVYAFVKEVKIAITRII